MKKSGKVQTTSAFPKLATFKGGFLGQNAAQISSGMSITASGDIAQNQTFWYSPEMTPTAWLLPRSRVETLKWVRIFFNLDPYIHSIIKMHAKYPFSEFTLDCKDEVALKVYEKAMFHGNIDWLDWVYQGSLSYNKFGEAICWGNWDKELGRWNSFTWIDPDVVEVKQDPFTEGIQVELVPTREIKKLVRDALLEGDQAKVPDVIINNVMNNRRIPLDAKGQPADIYGNEYEPPKVFVFANRTDPGAVRGTSPIQCLFQDLIYKDKIKLAQIAIADRHHLPIELWTVGHLTGDMQTSMLPTSEELEGVRDMIRQATAQAPFSIVYSPLLKYEALGVSGKLLSVYEDLGYVENQILVGLGVNKDLILGGSACIDEKSRIMTRGGLKGIDDLTVNDEVMTFNPETEEFEYNKPTEIFQYNYEGHLLHFKNKSIDHMVTPNHRCWVKQRDSEKWEFISAEDVKLRSAMRTTAEWVGQKQPELMTVAGETINVKDWFKFLGYWISEGWGNNYSNKYTEKAAWRMGISQSYDSDCLDDIRDVVSRLPFKFKEYKQQSKYIHKNSGLQASPMATFYWCNKALVSHIIEECGKGAFNKHIPEWVKNSDKEHLRIIFDSLMAGDGCVRKNRCFNKEYPIDSYTYTTASNQLASDMAEVMLKLGYTPIIYKDKRSDKYYISCSDSKKNRDSFRYIETEAKDIASGIQPVFYQGRVWCVNVKNHIFMCERNGKFVLTGNSFSNSKTLALHRLIMEYQAVRDLFTHWMQKNILLPIAKAHDLKDSDGNYIIPTIKWKKSLRPEQDKEVFDMFYKMYKDGLISTKTLFSKCPEYISFEKEQEALLEEYNTVFNKEDKRLPKRKTGPEAIETEPKKPSETEKPGLPAPEEKSKEEKNQAVLERQKRMMDMGEAGKEAPEEAEITPPPGVTEL